ncbi:MAG TPA: bifunctional glutamate N-acetyltransferase/amino-acid acetyltransferase ArgJ [Verrucomicrobia bacterium]|nr:MAG: bifunctional ornithine acetyltransferase/N-acetylglutamate synthase [Lentisphaerae bacterium GWF2_57_35]HBA84031.1 bifunctional glutamate N-acetyltransferase/amino-acid acetyltransferase ArgJ [Verrucomicrobiota bacterium]
MKTNKIKISDTIALPRGFKAAGVVAGLKKNGQPDMAMIFSEVPAVAAGTFTTNQVQAASVKLCRKRLETKTAHAVVVNSGNANACNGAQGLRDARRMTELTAELLGVSSETVYVSSTGRIGIPLKMDIIENGIRDLSQKLSTKGGSDAAHAIMTTDTKVKHGSIRLTIDGQEVTLSAMAKGAGMIEPNMATMLAYLMTDAAVNAVALQKCLSEAVELSFNRISIDGDMSTNDTVLFFANGVAGNRLLKPGHRDWARFVEAVRALTLSLAIKMVEDGEGVTKFVTIRVKGARNERDADIAARSVANSLLVKTSWVGEYPNWGRIMDALGYSEAKVVEEKVEMHYDGLLAVKNGVKAGAPIERLKKIQKQKKFEIDIDLHIGKGETVVYTCDCTEEYVRINM